MDQDGSVITPLVVTSRQFQREGEPPLSAGETGNIHLIVKGGRENGVRVIAVATGRSSVAELREAGADHVLDDLADVGLLVRLVAGRT
jgi:D-arabinose 1-dehydrogenase-like Zn-dependent alcohol dehydrogenase